jgi:hypothetical protein
MEAQPRLATTTTQQKGKGRLLQTRVMPGRKNVPSRQRGHEFSEREFYSLPRPDRHRETVCAGVGLLTIALMSRLPLASARDSGILWAVM